MATITEDYVSFEVAKLLKEKGFDVDECEVHYDMLDHTQYEITIQMAMKWLREVHNIDISIIPLRSNKEYLPRIESNILDYDAIPCKKYEEAAEVAIKYCLEHLI